VDEVLDANPMLRVERPRVEKQDNVKKLDPAAITAILAAIAGKADLPAERGVWVERDHAIVLTTLLAGLRVGELVGSNVGDVHYSEAGPYLHVRGMGNKERNIPVEGALVEVGKNSLRDSGPRLQRHRDRVAWQGILDRAATGLGAGRGPQPGDRRGPRPANLRRGACAM
jgi:integrase